MNKGRNLAILMCCLMVVSLLTLLSKSRNTNMSGVVDDVRYMKQSSDDSITRYEFYFIEDTVMVATVTSTESGTKEIKISYRGQYIEELDDYELLDYYDYYYVVQGNNKKTATVTAHLHDEFKDSTKDPHEFFTDEFFLTMIYGKEPFISIIQAVIVAVIAGIGGIIIGKSEEICVYFRKGKIDNYPTWEEIGVYRKIGGAVLAVAAVVLVIFVII